MTDEALIVDYDPFAMDSRVSLYKDGGREWLKVFSSMEEMASGLIDLAYTHNVYSIKVNGPFAVEGELKRMIEKEERNKYSEHKINVGGLG